MDTWNSYRFTWYLKGEALRRREEKKKENTEIFVIQLQHVEELNPIWPLLSFILQEKERIPGWFGKVWSVMWCWCFYFQLRKAQQKISRGKKEHLSAFFFFPQKEQNKLKYCSYFSLSSSIMITSGGISPIWVRTPMTAGFISASLGQLGVSWSLPNSFTKETGWAKGTLQPRSYPSKVRLSN